MTSAQIMDQRIEAYLNRLASALRRVPADDREDILREIGAHILDSVGGSADREAAIERVLRLLGTPEELASRYSTESLLARASHSFSPWLLLHTCWRWAKLGTKGTLAFFVALFGYTTAIALTVAIFLKPFIPSVGLWIGPEGLNVGSPTHPEVMHELLGKYFVPVIALVAFAFAIGTTHALRWMIRKRTPKRSFEMASTRPGGTEEFVRRPSA